MSIIKSRVHPIYSARMQQLDLNRLAKDGGRPYIDARLWRAPNETDAQWFGDPEEGIVGRKARSCLINDAQRIAAKIRQYIFKAAPERKGVNLDFYQNAAGQDVTIDEFMGRVCDAITTGQWAWIQVDAEPQKVDQNGNPVAQTLANKPRVFWRLWESCDIPDWSIDDDGTIRWVITRSFAFINSDPFTEAKKVQISTLYYLAADGNVYITEEADTQTPIPLRKNQIVPGLDRIPFVLVGHPSPKAWWFDDVENIQAQVMNYDSMHNETLTDAVYPQLVVPMALLNTLETNLDLDKLGSKQLITLQRELIKGRKNPFYEDAESKGTTRYIQPASGDLTMITDEQDRKRKLLFDMSGLALFNRESRQVQTAESKAFDNMDTNATLGNRAQMLQTAETAAVALSKYFDPGFDVYDPVYNLKFDVVDVAALGSTIQTISQMPNVTPMMRRILLRAGMRLVLEGGGVDPETYQKAIDEIDSIPDDQLETANPFVDLQGDGGDEEGDDDPEDHADPVDTLDEDGDDDGKPPQRRKVIGFMA